ncbi:MAG TPA: alpha/beta hydrolase [Stellaceae bacterium]|nr:alpha/beta hydrolase [Stellaceae bacterium]
MADGGVFPPGVAEKIKAIGPKFDNDILAQMRELYAPLVKTQSRAGVTVQSDIAYGSDPRQKLDLYKPEGRRLPVLVYIPGGGYVGGDKNADGVFYGNLGIYFARHGYLTIVANYRLAPAHSWPAGAQDVAGAIGWARKEAEAHGGDAQKLFLFGQSAGATHSASYLLDPQFHAAPGSGVTAGVLMSGGAYRVNPNPAPNQLAYFGADASQYEARSPITHVGKSKVPLFISVAEFDPGNLTAPSYDLARAVSLRDGRSPHFTYWRGHNHVSTVQSLGSSQDDVGARVREFLGGF